MSREFNKTILDRENQNLEFAQEDEEFAEVDEGQKNLKNMIGGKDIIQFKSIYIPEALIPLENVMSPHFGPTKVWTMLNTHGD